MVADDYYIHDTGIERALGHRRDPVYVKWVDSEHRICGDRIDTEGHTLLRAGSGTIWANVRSVQRAWILFVGRVKQYHERRYFGNGDDYDHGIDRRSERAPLL